MKNDANSSSSCLMRSSCKSAIHIISPYRLGAMREDCIRKLMIMLKPCPNGKCLAIIVWGND